MARQLVLEREPQLAEGEEPELRQDMTAVPRDASLILSDVRSPLLAVVCEACGRQRRYNVERLMAQREVDRSLANARRLPKARWLSINDRGKAGHQI
jgi:hypothetical protein